MFRAVATAFLTAGIVVGCSSAMNTGVASIAADGGSDAPGADGDADASGAPPTGSGTIGPGGGSVQSTDGRVTLTVPAGALTQPTVFTVAAAASAPAGTIGSAYDLEPEGTSFSVPATLTIAYDPSLLGAVAADAVTIATAVGDFWSGQLGTLVDPNAHVVGTLITHLSLWAITPVVIPSGDCACNGSIAQVARTCCQQLGGEFASNSTTCTCCGVELDPFVACYTPMAGGETVPNFCDQCLHGCCTRNGGSPNAVCDCVGDSGTWAPIFECATTTCYPSGNAPEWLLCGLQLGDSGLPAGPSCVAADASFDGGSTDAADGGCNTTNCPGCCDPTGNTCQPGDMSAAACGSGGAACRPCPPPPPNQPSAGPCWCAP
jgi:hypothetical protein